MNTLKLIAAPLAAAAMLVAPAAGAEEKNEPTAGEAKLAKMLEGRVAGEARSCISVSPNYHVKVIDGTALVYKSGSTLYVNVPRNAHSIDDDDTLVRRTSIGSRVCNTDIITTVDLTSGMYTGNVMLGDFVPYRKQG